MRIQPAFLFDLDGTLVDSVYQHVLAWKHALDTEGIDLSVWRIHRKIGMSEVQAVSTYSLIDLSAVNLCRSWADSSFDSLDRWFGKDCFVVFHNEA
jgi:beta-phosphoglucomutase-like phosphatase (HAD superfamily)